MKKTIFNRVIAICILLTLAACKFTLPPVTSATVERYQSGSRLQSAELNSEQIKTLSAWFAQHNSGWTQSVVSYVPKLEVRAMHSNGDTSIINLISTIVVVYNKSGQYQQSFLQSEVAELRAILERSIWHPNLGDDIAK
jgi:hypothetical protein